MALLSPTDRRRVQEMLAGMRNPVRLLFFSQTLNCETCLPAKQVLDELASLSDKVTVEEHNFLLERDVAAGHGVDRVPAVVLTTDAGARIRFFGAPTGYEFMSLLDAILVASTGESGLSADSRARLGELNQPVNLQVFVTPT
jgi:alkyl hydroperoxide reductase subunit AhpF